MQLTRVTNDLITLKQEFEHTQNSKTVGEHQLDHISAKVSKQAKLISKLCRDISKVSDLVSNISKEFALQNRTVPQYGIDDKPTSDTDRRGKQGDLKTAVPQEKLQMSLDDSLREANFFLKNIGEWLVAFAKLHKSTLKRQDTT